MIIVLFGQPGSGKTTLADQLYKEFDERQTCYHIDGDKLRDLFNNKDYSREGRIKNLNRASDIATYLNSYGTDVIVSLVYPYKEARDYLNSLTEDVKWVYLAYEDVEGQQRGREQFHVKDFEYPISNEALCLNTTWLTEKECLKEIKSYTNEKLPSKSSRDNVIY